MCGLYRPRKYPAAVVIIRMRADVVRRDGLLFPITEITPPREDDIIETAVRFRTVGDITCTCPVERRGQRRRGAERNAERHHVRTRPTRMDDRATPRRWNAASSKDISDGWGRIVPRGPIGARRAIRFMTAGSVDDGNPR